MTVNENRVQAGLFALGDWRLFIKISDLEVRISAEQEFGVFHLFLLELGESLHRNNNLELASGHALELALKLICVATEHLDDLGVLNAVKKLDGTAVVHESRDGTVKSLETKRCPDTSAQGVLGS